MDRRADAALSRVASSAIDPRKHDMKGQLQRLLNTLGRNPVKKTSDPVRIGVLGASQVATYALIWPSARLPDVQVAAVAARDEKRAAAYAKKHGIPVSYGSYQELLDDPSLEAIYVATPNGMHGDWAAAALAAGKHVLCEKPFTANADEARLVQGIAAKQQLLCREAFHYKEHPANQALADLLQSGVIGQLEQLQVQVLVPSWAFKEDDIRFQAKLAGGTMMDAGCYCAHTLRFFPGCSAPRVMSASAGKLVDGGRVDGCMTATLAYDTSSAGRRGGAGGGNGGGGAAGGGSVLGAGLVGRLEADLRHPGLWPVTRFTAQGSRGRVEMENFIMPFVGHTISLTRTLQDPSSGGSGPPHQQHQQQQKRSLAVYGSGESNYFYQLQRFISDLRVLEDKQAPKEQRRAVRAAMDADATDCIDNMGLIDGIYRAAGLPERMPTAAWVACGSGEARELLPASKCE